MHCRKKQIEFSDETLIAIDPRPDTVVAVGSDARRYIDAEDISVVCPLRNGAPAEFDVFATLLRHFLKKSGAVGNTLFSHSSLALCVPYEYTVVERRAFEDAFRASGCGTVLIDDCTYDEGVKKRGEKCRIVAGFEPRA